MMESLSSSKPRSGEVEADESEPEALVSRSRLRARVMLAGLSAGLLEGLSAGLSVLVAVAVVVVDGRAMGLRGPSLGRALMVGVSGMEQVSGWEAVAEEV